MSERPVCVITGGSRGIGLAAAGRFAAARYNLALCARSAQPLRDAAAALSSEHDCDVWQRTTDLTAAGAAADFVTQAANHFGRLDVLVNNAARAPNVPAAELTTEQVAQTTALNCSAVVAATTAAMAAMRGRGGVIVSLSSMAAVDPFPGFALYGGTKAFVETFTRAVANEGRGENIRAFAIRPGAVDTPMLRSLFPNFPAEQRLQPTDVADLIVAVCSNALRYSSGETITIRK